MSARAAIVVGTGADELTCAHFLARAGYRVTALEQHEPSDMATGWVPPAIVRAFGLARGRRFRIEQPDPWISVPLGAGGRLALWRDMARSVDSIRALSPADAAKWPAFCARMGRLAQLLETVYEGPPPNPLSRSGRDLARLAMLGLRAHRFGRTAIEDALRLATMPVADLLDDWFATDALKTAIAAGGIRDLLHGPRSGGTAYALLHRHVGCAPGVFRQPRSNLARVLADLPGVEIRRGARAAGILVIDGRAAGVVVENGDELRAPVVVSGMDPRSTITRLIDPCWLDPDLLRAARHIRSRGAAARVILKLERPLALQPLLIGPSLDYMERGYDDAKYGRISREPWLEAAAIEPARDGGWQIAVHVQYAPYALREGDWDEARCEALGALVKEMLSRHVRGLSAVVADRIVQSPRDLESVHGWPEGQPCHVEIALDQALWMRPLPALARYHAPVEGLYLCGPGMHPGAGIVGASGAHAARMILRDTRR